MDKNPKNPRFYKDRKGLNDFPKRDSNNFEMKEKDEIYQKGKYSKSRNSDSYSYGNQPKSEFNSLASDRYKRIYSEKPIETEEKWKHVCTPLCLLL